MLDVERAGRGQLGSPEGERDDRHRRVLDGGQLGCGHRREAVVVSRRLKIPQREQIDPDTQALAGDAGVVVVAGADKTP